MTRPHVLEPDPHPIRLVSVTCAQVSATKCSRGDVEDPDPGLRILMFRSALLDDASGFSCQLHVEQSVVVGDVLAEGGVVVEGGFKADGPISKDRYDLFTEYIPVQILWPHARAYLGQVGGILGVALADSLCTVPPDQDDPKAYGRGIEAADG